MNSYATKHGRTLEVRISYDNGETKDYEFTVRTKHEHGEDIELLGIYTLRSPDYFINKFIEEN